MPVSAKIEVYGVKDALKELNKIDPTLRKQITKDAKEVFIRSFYRCGLCWRLCTKSNS